jgi:hypothetical protein
MPHGVAQHGSALHGSALHGSVSPFNFPGSNLPLGRNGFPSSLRRSSASPLLSLPFPFLDDSFTPDDASSNGLPDPTQSSALLMQAMRALTGSSDSMGQPMSPPPSSQPSSSAPLMIELQNGRYVRVDGTRVNVEAVPLNLAPNHAQSHPPSRAAALPAPALSPAVLVFRDGHSEEVRDYTISGGMLYARGDYYTDGYWNKTIDLGTVNIAGTLQANANRNVKFVLPSSPNEVITRP